ncbi:hypothetical protein [Piscirickettsia litoralis]|uniref:Uncharacterized protein n=1 Tax=Piscirickettsia litoralis TaxID=1891921 RepID=A0ABX3A2Z6_9GAMM|nr:hypothetical protein [Piscirickettsia litoralis]ODN43249.1 hypothetical protein BGC07_10380 [Piscirickettsia litoralis]
MLINYHESQIDFEKVHNVIAKGQLLVFYYDQGSEETIELGMSDNDESEQVIEYIVNCYRRGLRKINLDRYLLLHGYERP